MAKIKQYTDSKDKILTWWSENGVPYVGYISKEARIEYKKQNLSSKLNFLSVKKVDNAKIELKIDAWDE